MVAVKGGEERALSGVTTSISDVSEFITPVTLLDSRLRTRKRYATQGYLMCRF